HAPAQPPKSLMVGGVYCEAGAVHRPDKTGGSGLVETVRPPDLSVALHMLKKGASQCHIQHLKPPADPQHRLVRSYKGGGKFQFPKIPGLVHVPAVLPGGAVEPGVDVSASGEQQAVPGTAVAAAGD